MAQVLSDKSTKWSMITNKDTTIWWTTYTWYTSLVTSRPVLDSRLSWLQVHTKRYSCTMIVGTLRSLCCRLCQNTFRIPQRRESIWKPWHRHRSRCRSKTSVWIPYHERRWYSWLSPDHADDHDGWNEQVVGIEDHVWDTRLRTRNLMMTNYCLLIRRIYSNCTILIPTYCTSMYLTVHPCNVLSCISVKEWWTGEPEIW